jgi:hypothetical protein
MERYFISGVLGRAEPCDGGPWVLYRDAQAAVKEATKRAEDAERERDEWKRDAENAGKERWAETQRAERAEAYVAGENLRSDFRTAAEMRAALDEARERIAALTGIVSSETNDVARRLALAVAEVRAFRSRHGNEPCVLNSKSYCDLCEAMQATDADPVLAKMIGGE